MLSSPKLTGRRSVFKSGLHKIESGVDLHNLSEPSTPSGLENIRRFSRLSSGDSEDRFLFGRLASPAASVASSGRLFAEPAQTLLFLDWDDTLFPCSDLFQRHGLPRRSKDWTGPLSPELDAELESWRKAVEDFLRAACVVSDRCVIVTNSKAPWVLSCVQYFAPNLLPFFQRKDGSGPIIAYASEAFRAEQAARTAREYYSRYECYSFCDCISQTFRSACSTPIEATKASKQAQRSVDLTQAKLAAMRREAHIFYNRYPGQTWKNVLSLGDMRYEHDAVKELSATRVPTQTREQLRTKSIILPTGPYLSELTLQLRVWCLLLPTFARYDGDLDLDLTFAGRPFEALAKVLNIPQLARIPLPLDPDEDPFTQEEGLDTTREPLVLSSEAIDELLDELAVALHEPISFAFLTPSH